MLLHICVISILNIYYTNCNCIDKSSEFPTKESDYEVRPNLFIDTDNLLGKNLKGHNGHGKATFTYSAGPYGPSHWAKLFPKCGGKNQSPVDIEISALKRISLPKLKFSELYEKLPQKMTISNTRNTLVLNAFFENEGLPKLEGGPLGRPYLFSEIHFHWSSGDHKGSEHTINKKTFPMEMHVVNYRSDLNLSNAVTSEKGISVIGYIFEIGDKCNEAIASILAVVDQVKLEHDTPIELTNLFRLDSIIDKFEKEYVTYQGSFTTPPCYETITWIISPYTLTISKKQIEKFRAISMSSQGFGDNYRATQALNGRILSFVQQNI